MITVNLLTVVVASYAIVHVLTGLSIHRSALKDYEAYNDLHMPDHRILPGEIIALFLHRLLFGLPHRIITLCLVLPLSYVIYVFCSAMSKVAMNKKPSWGINPRMLKTVTAVGGRGTRETLWMGLILTAALVVLGIVAFCKAKPECEWHVILISLTIYVVGCIVYYFVDDEITGDYQ